MKNKCIACQNVFLEKKYTGVSDYEYGTYKKVDYLWCPNCRLLVQQPLPKKNLIPSFYPPDYRNHLQVQSYGIFSALKSFQINFLANKLTGFLTNKNAKVLEIGCGSGLLLMVLKQKGITQLWGTDISDAAAENLTSQNIKFQRSDIDKRLPFNQKFDMIILNHVIEHVLEPGFVLTTCYNHLTKGGKIIVITPNSRSIVCSVFGKFWDGINAPRHIYIFSNTSMEYLGKSVGVRLITSQSALDPMPWALSLQNFLQTLSWFRTTLKNGLAWYTVFVGLLCIPITFAIRLTTRGENLIYTLE